MPAKVISSDKLAATVFRDADKEIVLLKSRHAIPSIAVILVGSSPASELYIEKKKQAADALGIDFDLFRFKESVSEREIITLISALNRKLNIFAILVQLPLPKHMKVQKVIDSISPLKDVDGFTSFNLGLLAHGEEGIVSCTAQAILRLIESTNAKIKGSNVCIVNHSIVVGRPFSQLMLNRGATVTICNEFTKNLGAFTKQADILVTAVGKPGLIKADMVKPGAIVIDAGIARQQGKTFGDVDFENVKKAVSFITPVPGGVGPMTVACLMQNVVKLTALQRK